VKNLWTLPKKPTTTSNGKHKSQTDEASIAETPSGVFDKKTMQKPTYAYLNGKVVEVIKQEDNGTFLIKLEERLYWVEAHELTHIKLWYQQF